MQKNFDLAASCRALKRRVFLFMCLIEMVQERKQNQFLFFFFSPMWKSRLTVSGAPETLELNTNFKKINKSYCPIFFRNVFFLQQQRFYADISSLALNQQTFHPDVCSGQTFIKAGWPHANRCCLNPPERTALSAHTGTS